MTKPASRAPIASELRALRLLTAMIAVTTLAAAVAAGFATGLPNAVSAPPAYRAALVAAIAVPLVAGACAPWSGKRMLRALNAGTAIAFAVLLVGFLLLEVPALGPAAQIPWFLTVTAAPVTAALVAWGRIAAWVWLGASTALVQVIRVVSGGDAQDAIANDTFALFVAATLLLLTGQFVAASRQFDAATAVAAAAAARRSADEAQRATAERLRLLVHDELLSTLALAARVAPSLREAVGRQAARARRLIRELRAAPDAPGTADAARPAETGLAARLSAVVAQLAPDARLVIVPGAPPTMPADVEIALLAAARQSLANSVAHAGDDTRRTVTLHCDGDGVRLVVHDDGQGFDPDAVAPNRMGIAESILGRMRSLPGGSARLVSRPGEGTAVELGWRPATTPPPGPGQPATASVMLARGAADRLYGVAVAVLLLAQAVLAVLAALRTGDVATPALTLAGVASGFVVLGPMSPRVPSRRRTALVAAITLTTGAVSWLPVARDPERCGDVWFIASLGFVLVVLAMRGRPRAALLTAAGTAVLTLLGVIVQHNDGPDVVAATTRMLAIVGIGCGFVLGILRVRARTTALRREELRAVREESYRDASSRELRGRTAELEALIGDLLERLAGPDELDTALRRECVVLEGRLRDGYRAARLARHPLVDAAAAARGRGVDVAIFDDPDGRELDEAELDRIAGWLAARLDETAAGRFTGRVLPAGRPAAASAASDEQVAELPHLHR